MDASKFTCIFQSMSAWCSGLRKDRFTSYWSVIAPDKTQREVEAEKYILVVPLGSNQYLRPLCTVRFQRWMLFVAAFVAQFCNGSLYAWSILNVAIDKHMQEATGEPPLQRAVVTFYVACGFLGVASSLFGPFVERRGPRASLMLGTALILTGHLIAFASIEMKWYASLYFGYGFFCGVGFGINYIAPVSALQKWFPDLRGTAGGFAVCGFGAGAAVWGALYNPLLHAVGIATLFLVVGAGLSTILLLTAWILRTPPPGYIVKGRDVHGLKVTTALLQSNGRTGGNATNGGTLLASGNDRVSAMLGDVQLLNFAKAFDYQEEELDEAELFYHNKVKNLRLRDCIVSIDFALLYVAFLTSVATGIIIMSRVFNIGQDVYNQSDGVLTKLVMMLAIFNFLGRLVCPIVSDGLIRMAELNPAFGRKLVLAILLLAQLVVLALLPSLMRDPSTFDCFQIVMFVLTFAYGGCLGTIPSFLTDMYGVYNTGTMHGLILTCWSLCAVVGGLTFTYLFNTMSAAGGSKIDAYVFNFTWLLGLVCLGCVTLPFVRTNPVDRFFPGYQFSFNGRPIIRRMKDGNVSL